MRIDHAILPGKNASQRCLSGLSFGRRLSGGVDASSSISKSFTALPIGAFDFRGTYSQGVALGYHIAGLWPGIACC